MNRHTLTSIAVTCLFVVTTFFLSCVTTEAGTKVAGLSHEDVDSQGLPVASRSPMLGTALPERVSLRNEMPPVADQGDLQSTGCVAFATAYYQMTQYLKHFKHPSWDLKNPEHQCSPLFPGAGGHPIKVYDSLMESGCVDNADMMYKQFSPAGKQTRDQIEAAKPYRISGYAALWDHGDAKPPYVPGNSIENAKAWLAAGHVLSVDIDPNAPGFPDSSDCSGPKRFYDVVDLSGYEYSPGHGVAICGYDDNINPNGKGPDHRGGFLMVNSHGPRWNGQMKGYIWLSYAYVKQYVSYAYIMMMSDESDAPVITGATAENGQITITGKNFGSFRRVAGLTFSGVRAQLIKKWTNESVTATRDPHCSTSSFESIVLYDWEGTPSNAFPLEIP
jgi:hypothetical protein